MLSAEKGQLPLCLYLDTNKWIDLSRAHYHRPGGEAFSEALTVIKDSVEAGHLVVPLPDTQTQEAMKCGKEDSRERLIRFMVGVSQNQILPAETEIQPKEVRNAIRLLLGRPTIPIRPNLLRRGLWSPDTQVLVLNGTPEQQRSLAEKLNDPSMTIDVLLDTSANRPLFDHSKKAEGENVPKVGTYRKWLRAELKRDEAYLTTLFALLEDPVICGAPLDALFEQEATTGAEVGAMLQSADDMHRFGRSIPTLHTFATLLLGQEHSQPTAQNDLRDLSWLSVALPYADIVVMERSWGNVARRHQLDTTFTTRVLADLRQLPALFREIGIVPSK